MRTDLGRIIRLGADRHREAQTLLPWYVTGRLEAAEHAQVEAHVNSCRECQGELKFQRRLNAEIAHAPLEVEQGWRQMRQRIESEAWRPAAWLRGLRAPWLGWAAAATLVLALGGSLVLRPAPFAADRTLGGAYHTLGAAQAPAAGNLVVMFRPETSEQTLRGILTASHARLVDGPTITGAYVLHVPPAERAGVAAELQGRKDIVLAQPIDAGAKP